MTSFSLWDTPTVGRQGGVDFLFGLLRGSLERRSYCVAHAGFKPRILLPRPPERAWLRSWGGFGGGGEVCGGNGCTRLFLRMIASFSISLFPLLICL